MATPTPHPPGTLSYQDKGWKLSSIGHVISVCVFESPILFFELFSVVQFFGNRNYFRVSRFFLSVPRPPFVSVSCQSCRCLIYSSNLLSPVNFFSLLRFAFSFFFFFRLFIVFFDASIWFVRSEIAKKINRDFFQNLCLNYLAHLNVSELIRTLEAK